MGTIETLPAYLYGDCCTNRHYLTMNKDLTGRWSAGYCAFDDGHPLDGLYFNGAVDIHWVANRMERLLKRKRHAKSN